MAESDGMLTGCQGDCSYRSEDTGDTFALTFDNPYDGSNSVGKTSSSGIQVTWGNYQGDNVNTTVDIRD